MIKTLTHLLLSFVIISSALRGASQSVDETSIATNRASIVKDSNYVYIAPGKLRPESELLSPVFNWRLNLATGQIFIHFAFVDSMDNIQEGISMWERVNQSIRVVNLTVTEEGGLSVEASPIYNGREREYYFSIKSRDLGKVSIDIEVDVNGGGLIYNIRLPLRDFHPPADAVLRWMKAEPKP